MNRKNGADGIARSEIKEFSNAWLDEVVEYRSDLLVTVGVLLAVAAAAAAPEPQFSGGFARSGGLASWIYACP